MTGRTCGRNLTIAMVAACPFPTSQGTQVFIGQLVTALRQRGHRVHLVTYHFGETDGSLGRDLHRARRLPFVGKLTSGPSGRKLLFDGLLALRLDQVVRQQKAEIIHAHNYEGALVGLMVSRWRKIPMIFHTHNTMTHELPAYSSSAPGRAMASRLGRLLDRQLPKRADACIALTDDIAGFICRWGTPLDRIWTIPPAIAADQFVAPEPPEPAPEKADWHLLYAGNLDRYQNFHLALESLREVLAHHRRCLLEVVTNSPLEATDREVRAMGLAGHVRWIQTASFEVMRQHLMGCDLALLPRISAYGFPIKMLNYLAAGKPMVICRSSAHGIRHGVNGWVAENDDVGDFARGIIALMENPSLRQALSQNARQMAREYFSWERWAPRYEEVYHRTLERWAIRGTH